VTAREGKEMPGMSYAMQGTPDHPLMVALLSICAVGTLAFLIIMLIIENKG
jgi:hypothetical protein